MTGHSSPKKFDERERQVTDQIPATTGIPFWKQNQVASMSRRGNCYDNAVAESFFLLLKRERIRRKTYLDRDETRRDVLDYIEMFYAPKEVPLWDNPKRRHGYANDVSPVEFENQYTNRRQSV